MQLYTIALLTFSALALWGWPVARSAFLGGITAFLPNIYFALRFGIPDPARTAREILKAFYVGETIKLITTAVLFFLILQLPDIRFLPLFAGFALVLAVFWFALLVRDTDS